MSQRKISKCACPCARAAKLITMAIGISIIIITNES